MFKLKSPTDELQETLKLLLVFEEFADIYQGLMWPRLPSPYSNTLTMVLLVTPTDGMLVGSVGAMETGGGLVKKNF